MNSTIRKEASCMNNTIIFKSSFARVINEYLRIRQSQGVNIAHELTIMKELDQIMARHGKPVERITRELIEEWQSMQFNESDRTKYAKACQMIRFCTYLATLESTHTLCRSPNGRPILLYQESSPKKKLQKFSALPMLQLYQNPCSTVALYQCLL